MTSEEMSIRESVGETLNEIAVVDIHTHLYDPAFGSLLLWGIDELLTYILQHSDACVLEQLLYKWYHSREIIGDVLTKKYVGLKQAGLRITEEIIQRDVNRLFDGKLISQET